MKKLTVIKLLRDRCGLKKISKKFCRSIDHYTMFRKIDEISSVAFMTWAGVTSDKRAVATKTHFYKELIVGTQTHSLSSEF